MRYTIIPVTDYQQNCTLLVCEKSNKAALVDPGGDLDILLREVEEQGVELEAILVTHGHMDHIGGVAALSKQLNLPIIGPHRDDEFWIQSLTEQCRMFGFPKAESFQPSRWLTDGDTVQVGEQVLQVIHCPGHTPGHVVFFNADERLAIVGDVLFKGSIGRTDFPRGDYQTLIDSIQLKLWPLGGDIAFIPGHGPMSTFAEEMRNNPFVAVR
ncbi:MBL fold metallo-hydrolase [Methylomonas methanica]|uniref:Beta-lactamase-like protein n=1 Tax=Methylomonas methanica (strain DSM 25384 / MC09) TaxID=857087 RepID=G0A498_METMM|nr:MBL fold metallo-hydrolase [Methylomonas methanica]AEG00314.1 beta-lactamase-like protein [Methylomonas methanica MC09]